MHRPGSCSIGSGHGKKAGRPKERWPPHVPPERRNSGSSAGTSRWAVLGHKDEGAWTIPKGLINSGETPLSAAKREFAEETGHRPKGKLRPLGEARQPGGKIVHVFAIEGDWDPARLKSNTFEMTWPPPARSARNFPELNRVAWFDLAERGGRF